MRVRIKKKIKKEKEKNWGKFILYSTFQPNFSQTKGISQGIN